MRVRAEILAHETLWDFDDDCLVIALIHDPDGAASHLLGMEPRKRSRRNVAGGPSGWVNELYSDLGWSVLNGNDCFQGAAGLEKLSGLHLLLFHRILNCSHHSNR
jgi:hypothetical protein